MAVLHIERVGSGDFTAGATGVQGRKLFTIVGATSHEHAEAYAVANNLFPLAINNIPRGSVDVKAKGGGIYELDADYASAVRPDGPPAGGIDPGGHPPGSEPPNSGQAAGRELTFATGGGTERIFMSKATRHGVGRGQERAPSFGGLIGVNPVDRTVAGCEVVSPKGEFTISQRFASMQVGWFLRFLRATATTNRRRFWGAEPGEVLFYGADGGYRPGDAWNVSGRFGFQRTRKNFTVGELVIPECRGWDYLWFIYGYKVEAGIGVAGAPIQVDVAFPRFGYVERVYDEEDFSFLGMG